MAVSAKRGCCVFCCDDLLLSGFVGPVLRDHAGTSLERQMDRLEKILIYGSLALMALFTAMVLYASMGMGIHLPTSHHEIAPFTESKVETADNSSFEVRYVARMW